MTCPLPQASPRNLLRIQRECAHTRRAPPRIRLNGFSYPILPRFHSNAGVARKVARPANVRTKRPEVSGR